MGAHVGRDVLVDFAIADEDANPDLLTFINLGMMRGKSIKTSWDTADTTADALCIAAGAAGIGSSIATATMSPNIHALTGGETIIFTDMNGASISYTVKIVQTIEPTALETVKESPYDLVLYTCTTGGKARVMIGCDRAE